MPSDFGRDFGPPGHIEPRVQFPRHSDHIGQVLSGEQAAALAARRLREWQRDNRPAADEGADDGD